MGAAPELPEDLYFMIKVKLGRCNNILNISARRRHAQALGPQPKGQGR